VLSVLDAGRDLLLRGPIAGKLIGDHDARRPALPLQQLAQEPFGGPFVPPALHQDVEHDALLVHRAPHPVGEVLAELERPLPYGLVADDDAAGGQHLLDHAQAEREAEIQPNRVADDLGRKAVASVAGEGRRRHPVRLPALLPIRKRPAAKLTWRYCGPVPSSCNRGLIPSDPLRRAGMEQYIGLDVSQEQSSVCVVDGGKVIWEGKCTPTPEAIAATIRTRAPEAVRIGLESGPLSAWHWHALRKLGLPVVCLDARHVKAALALQLNKSDRNDARGLAQIVRTGWYREVAVKSVDSHLVRS